MPKAKLTKSYIDGLTPEAQDSIHWDTELKGLHLKVTPAGKKVFFAYYRANGATAQQRRYKVGDYGAVTVQQARQIAAKVLGEVAEGKDPSAQRRANRQRLNGDRLDGLVSDFLAKHASRNRSASETERIFRSYVLPRFGARTIHEIGKRDIVQMLEAIAASAPIMANRTLAAIRKFFNWCHARAIIDKSPCEGIEAPGKETKRDRLLTDDELRNVLATARDIGFPYGSVVELLAITGQRREEVAAMCWSELDLGARTWTIPISRSKNGKAHIVHLSDAALSALGPIARIENSDLVFTTNGRSSFQGWSKAKAALDARSSVADWTLHDLRRTVVSGMARLGVAPHVADKVLNHQTGTLSGVAGVYQRHDFIRERQHALNVWGQHVEGLLAATTKAA